MTVLYFIAVIKGTVMTRIQTSFSRSQGMTGSNPSHSSSRKRAEMNKKEIEAVRGARVRRLFEEIPLEDRSENGVLLFYGWLYQHHPELLPKGLGDLYQHLKVDLSGLYK